MVNSSPEFTISFSLAPYVSRVYGGRDGDVTKFLETSPTAIFDVKSGVGVMGMVPGLPPENLDSRLL